MFRNRFAAILVVVLLCIAANAATPVVHTVRNVRLANGWQISGTITTDGTTGALTAGNILDWSLELTQTTDLVWTEKNSTNLNISGVWTDGKKIHVSTSPDGFVDGGTLYFERSGAAFSIPTAAIIADFTQLSVNLGYGYGGLAGWQDELLGLNFVGLNQQNNVEYHAASAFAGRANVFRINVPTLATNPLLMTMFGTITTDGSIGALLPQNIIAWKITARSRDISFMTKTNSMVMQANGVFSDGQNIKVDHSGGQLVIGRPGFRPTYVTLADFTDPTYRNGFANYYMGNFGIMGDKYGLVGNKAVSYTVASVLF